MFTLLLFMCSDKQSGLVVLVCELMDMNMYELIKGLCCHYLFILLVENSLKNLIRNARSIIS